MREKEWRVRKTMEETTLWTTSPDGADSRALPALRGKDSPVSDKLPSVDFIGYSAPNQVCDSSSMGVCQPSPPLMACLLLAHSGPMSVPFGMDGLNFLAHLW